MDEFNFDNLKDIAQDNFYNDDFAHLNIYDKDANGNSGLYKSQDDYFFDNPDEDSADFY